MSIPSAARGRIALRFQVLFPHLNERQRRLLVATEARLVGHGGVRAVAEVAGVSETTVRKGVFELEQAADPLPDGRVRRPGGGRMRAEDLDAGLVPALLALVEPDERGDPMSPLRWTTKSLRHLAAELARQGHSVSAPTVGRLLRANGFSLQANIKTLEGRQHPDRDDQFRYINEQIKEHQAAGEPVISVDAKKKEQLGLLPAAGREWRPKGEPVQVEDHSFFSGSDTDHAIPYGVYDVTANTGWVNVGVDHDTSAFAVASIRRWWQARGRHDYPQARRLLITADAGGSKSYRFRLWKAELADFAGEAGVEITVCHFPPGTSKWNKIEHRLFSHITMNWRGRPLTSHEVVVNTIAATRTATGLQVGAELDTGAYPTGLSISKQRMNALPIRPHQHRGAWNYTIVPALPAPDEQSTSASRAQSRAEARQTLAHPALTGMTRQQFDALAARLASLQAAQDEQRCYEQRGRRRINAPGAGARPLLSPADRLLITVVYLRQSCTQRVLSNMLEINPNSISKAIAETTRLLDQQRHTITATTLRFTTVQAITDYLSSDSSATPRPDLPHTLSHPSLTGMSRAELADLVCRAGNSPYKSV
ncbi:ISAzo13 family transposase [Micromonospora sp. NBC_01412]|uniref:ISAzo13 family transposase n=1 Tax=Micromonospora sp. NBC_01412 TaxID=2903590 RepID=UPI0032558FE2